MYGNISFKMWTGNTTLNLTGSFSNFWREKIIQYNYTIKNEKINWKNR